MIFSQQLFNVCTVDALEQFMHGGLFLHAQFHIGEGTAIPQHDGGVQQIADVIGATTLRETM